MMKRFIHFSIFMLSVLYTVQAQQDSIYPKNTCKTWISLKNEPMPMKGVLFEVRDMSIMLSNTTRNKDYYKGSYDVAKVDVRQIDAIELKTKNYLWEGGKVGVVFGFIAGGAIGCHYYFATSEHNENVWGDACGGAAVGAVLGALIGALIPEKIKISINGSQVKFDLNKKTLKDYSVK